MKTQYQKPTMNVVKIQSTSIICQSINRVSGADISYGGRGSGAARARSHGDWDDDWDE